MAADEATNRRVHEWRDLRPLPNLPEEAHEVRVESNMEPQGVKDPRASSRLRPDLSRIQLEHHLR